MEHFNFQLDTYWAICYRFGLIFHSHWWKLIFFRTSWENVSLPGADQVQIRLCNFHKDHQPISIMYISILRYLSKVPQLSHCSWELSAPQRLYFFILLTNKQILIYLFRNVLEVIQWYFSSAKSPAQWTDPQSANRRWKGDIFYLINCMSLFIIVLILL